MKTPNQMIEAAQIVGGPGSKDELRAAYQLLAASSADIQAQLVHVYEQSQNDLTKEIVRLKNNDLVTVHVSTALQRIDGILNKLRNKASKLTYSAAKTGVLQGKIQGAIRDLNAERVASENEAAATALVNFGCRRDGLKLFVTESTCQLLYQFSKAVTPRGTWIYNSPYLGPKEILDVESTDKALNGAYIELPSRRLVVTSQAEKELSSAFLSRLEKMSAKAVRHNIPGTSTAFVLSKGDKENIERIVSQTIGKLDVAINCAKENIHSQIAQASNRARSTDPDELPQNDPVKQPAPSAVDYVEEDDNKSLSAREREELETDPVKGKNGLLLETKQHIGYMKRLYAIGRREQDVLRQKTLAEIAKAEAGGTTTATKGLILSLLNDGVVAFQDRSGRRWTLGHYCEMATRTGARQSINIGELYSDETHDLYYIVPRGSNCPVCSRYEGRVYSRSGKDPRFPPLYKAFGKIDPDGPDSIENTYVSIHPNCRHALARWNEKTRTPQELAEMQEKSNQPFDIDPRTEEQVKRYKEKERWQGIHDDARKMFRLIGAVLGFKRVGAYPTFEKHFIKKDKWYKDLYNEYKTAMEGKQ